MDGFPVKDRMERERETEELRAREKERERGRKRKKGQRKKTEMESRKWRFPDRMKFNCRIFRFEIQFFSD